MSQSEMSYEDFVAKKITALQPDGIDVPLSEISDKLFPFQRDVVRWALRQGRAALFCGTGLGKTAMQLTWAAKIHERTGHNAIVLAPLAVAAQTVREGKKFGVDVTLCRSQADVRAGVNVANYEMLHAFDVASFGAVVLDESSILKSYTGTTKRALVESFARTPFRLACTATPAPNDHMELGNHSEFLGVLSAHQMLTRWFINDTSLFGNYRLKGHAVEPFWDWVCSWARCAGKPSDLGYDDGAFALPELRLHKHSVDVDIVEGREKSGTLFRIPEMSATSIHREKRISVDARAEAIAQLVAAEPIEPWIVWCDTDYEADALTARMPDAIEVRGSHSSANKEASLVAFSLGEIRVLITKPKIGGFGLNWQHCARVAFIGAGFSYEQFYQAIRRCWRFGQTRAVDVHVAISEAERVIWDVLVTKQSGHEAMQRGMFDAARRALNATSHSIPYEATHVARLPSFLTPSLTVPR